MARQGQVIAFQHVRIFDGVGILPYDTLVIQGGTITAIGDETVLPPEAEIINGTGQTLPICIALFLPLLLIMP
jgi:imidazolonepropionase-like amidohydrolase